MKRLASKVTVCLFLIAVSLCSHSTVVALVHETVGDLAGTHPIERCDEASEQDDLQASPVRRRRVAARLFRVMFPDRVRPARILAASRQSWRKLDSHQKLAAPSFIQSNPPLLI